MEEKMRQEPTETMPIWEKYTLTLEEAAKYFRIGQHKLRQIAEENPYADFLLCNGNRIQFKSKLFEKFIVEATVI